MKVLIAGDFCPQYKVAELFEKGELKTVLEEVKPIIEQADYSIVNFECPVCKGGERLIPKQGPNLKCTEKGIEAVKWAGFNCVTLANNHFLDFGEQGVENTLAACKKHGLDHVGGGNSLKEASAIRYKEIDGKILAVINCCEHEFSIATETTAGSNPLNPIQQYYAIKEARENADYVLVIVHGGHEMWQLPSPRMQETYRFFVDAGADVVVNHHQHCYSGYEVYNNKPIFYGLGNFCFDKAKKMEETWYEGYMVEINFSQKDIVFTILPYLQCKASASIKSLPVGSFDSKLNYLNSVITDNQELKSAIEDYYEKCKKTTQWRLEPIRNRWVLFAQYRGWIPSLITTKWKIYLKNMVSCESHRDKLHYYFEKS